MKNWKNISFFLLFFVIGSMLFSCNKDMPRLVTNGDNSQVQPKVKQNKVLMIMVPGLRGLAVREIRPKNLTNMEKKAIYAFNGMAEPENPYLSLSKINAWTNLFTGVKSVKTSAGSGNWSDVDLDRYPTFITRMKETHPSWKTAAFSSSDDLKDKYFNDVDEAVSFSDDDQATFDATVQALQDEKDTNRLVITEFNGVKKAGNTYGYNADESHYAKAVYQVDSLIGQLIETLESRSDYNKWLVIVVSGKGGKANVPFATPTAFGDMRRNSFILFYNAKFQEKFTPKPLNSNGISTFSGWSARLWGNPEDNDTSGVNAVVQASDQSELEPGDDTLTLVAKVKFLPHNNESNKYENSPFISKTNHLGTNSGWCLYRDGNYIIAYVSDGTNTMEIISNNVADNKWHTIGLMIWNEGGNKRMSLYVDGSLIDSKRETMGTITSSSKLTFGYNPTLNSNDDAINMRLADVHIWDIRLSDDLIQQYGAYPGAFLSDNLPHYDDMVASWTCMDGSGNTFHDLFGNYDADLNAGGGATVDWEYFSEVSELIATSFVTPNFYRSVLNTIDVPVQALQWLGIKIQKNWRIDGKGWLTGYTDVVNPE